MAMEELQLLLKRAKPKEHRVRGLIVFKYSGRTKELQAANEPLFWKTVDHELKKMGFMGPYPRDEDEKKLYSQMREHPERKFNLSAWGGMNTPATGFIPEAEQPPAPEPEEPKPKKEKEDEVPNVEEALNAFAENIAEEKSVDPPDISEILDETPQEPGEVETPPTPDELLLLSHKELQAYCHRYELKTTGNKVTLRSRINNYFKKLALSEGSEAE